MSPDLGIRSLGRMAGPQQAAHLGTSRRATTTPGAVLQARAPARLSHLNLHSIPLFLHRSQGMLPVHLVLEAVQSSHDFLRVPREPRRKPSFGSALVLSGCKSTASWLISGLSPGWFVARARAGASGVSTDASKKEVDARRSEQTQKAPLYLYPGRHGRTEGNESRDTGMCMNAT